MRIADRSVEVPVNSLGVKERAIDSPGHWKHIYEKLKRENPSTKWNTRRGRSEQQKKKKKQKAFA